MATIVGLLLMIPPMSGGIDDGDALEWLLTRGIIFVGLGIALLVLSVIVHRRWEPRR